VEVKVSLHMVCGGSRSFPLSTLRPAEGTGTALRLDLSVKSMTKVIGVFCSNIQNWKKTQSKDEHKVAFMFLSRQI